MSQAKKQPSTPSGAYTPPLHRARLPLMRPNHGRMIAGVCRGISLHLDYSVAWIRIAFVLACALSGAGLVAYVLLWVLLPSGDPYEAAAKMRQESVREPLAKGNARFFADVGFDPQVSLLDIHTAAFVDSMQYTDFTEVSMDNDDPNGSASLSYTGRPHTPWNVNSESLQQALANASKPALFAFAAVACGIAALVIARWQVDYGLLLPVLLALLGTSVAWLRFNDSERMMPTLLAGLALIFCGFTLLMVRYALMNNNAIPTGVAVGAGLGLLACTIGALSPWMITLTRRVAYERASKEREEERADMTAHLHDGVLQTLALIQLHAKDSQQVFALARSQERELRSWLYAGKLAPERSIAAGLQQIAADIEDEYGKAVDVVTVGDAQPSAQTDALLDAAHQAILNAVKHGAEPISVYCEADEDLVELFVRDHGQGFDVHTIAPDRLGLRESIIGRIERRGGTVEIVSRAHWGTEVRMHMPITARADDAVKVSSHE